MKFRFLLFLLSLFLCACAAAQSTHSTSYNGENTKLSIFAGEQVYVEIAIQNNMIVGLKKVSNITNPSSTLTFNFMKGDNGKSMTLSVKNPLASSLKYHIDMVDYKGRLYNTSSCPVLAGLSGYEYWPHLIPEIRITNFHFASEMENVCIY